MVCGVEGLEIIRGGEITPKLVAGAVDGRCELSKVEYIQDAMVYQSLYSCSVVQSITLKLTD